MSDLTSSISVQLRLLRTSGRDDHKIRPVQNYPRNVPLSILYSPSVIEAVFSQDQRKDPVATQESPRMSEAPFEVGSPQPRHWKLGEIEDDNLSTIVADSLRL